MMGKPHTTQTGFTLIEVMVALTIIAVALGSLIKASGSHTKSASYLKSKTLAHYVGLNEITQLQVDRSFPSLGITRKSADMAGVEWYWTREVLVSINDNIRIVKFTVYGDEARNRNLAQLQGYITNPNASTAITTGGAAGGVAAGSNSAGGQ